MIWIIVLVAVVVITLIVWGIDGRFRVGAAFGGIVGLLGMLVMWVMTLV